MWRKRKRRTRKLNEAGERKSKKKRRKIEKGRERN
jgi:hypothetical protein